MLALVNASNASSISLYFATRSASGLYFQVFNVSSAFLDNYESMRRVQNIFVLENVPQEKKIEKVKKEAQSIIREENEKNY